MNQNESRRSFFPDELDPTVRTALEDMLSRSPDENQLEAALERLRRPSRPPESPRGVKPQQRRWRLVATVAASFMLCLLWFGAQTETWGRVAQDYQRPTAQELPGANAATPDTPMSDRDGPVGSWRRFVLIVHVFGLSIGLLGLLVAWSWTVGYWLITILRRGSDRRFDSSWGQRIQLLALIAYGCGIAFGCIWSQATWRVPWRWDPREALALVTLGIAIMWYATSKPNDAVDLPGQAIRAVFLASLAWWMVALLYVLGGIYTPRLHSYGFPSPLPTAVACLWGLNMLPLIAAYLIRTSRRCRSEA